MDGCLRLTGTEPKRSCLVFVNNWIIFCEISIKNKKMPKFLKIAVNKAGDGEPSNTAMVVL